MEKIEALSNKLTITWIPSFNCKATLITGFVPCLKLISP